MKQNNNIIKSNSEFIIFKTEDEKISVDVLFENETVWLTQDQMAFLFDKAKSTISEHIKHIFEEKEFDKNVAVRNFRITTQHGAIEGKTQESTINLYNLDVIISVGYCVKSLRGTQFRQWATKRLNEYIRKGFTMDDERLKNLGAGSISHEQAVDKATSEYKKYQQQTLSEVEKNYLESLKMLENKTKDNQ